MGDGLGCSRAEDDVSLQQFELLALRSWFGRCGTWPSRVKSRGLMAEPSTAHPERCRQRWVVLVGLMCGAASCSPSAAPGATALPIVATPITPAPAAPPEPLLPDGTPALDARLVERVPEGTFGPYLGSAPDGRAVVLWAALAENAGWRWFSSALDAKGVPSKPRALADAPSELSLAASLPRARR